jgi:hypothetical protein
MAWGLTQLVLCCIWKQTVLNLIPSRSWWRFWSTTFVIRFEPMWLLPPEITQGQSVQHQLSNIWFKRDNTARGIFNIQKNVVRCVMEHHYLNLIHHHIQRMTYGASLWLMIWQALGQKDSTSLYPTLPPEMHGPRHHSMLPTIPAPHIIPCCQKDLQTQPPQQMQAWCSILEVAGTKAVLIWWAVGWWLWFDQLYHDWEGFICCYW